MTLQGLELWPSAQVALHVGGGKGGGGAAAASSASSASSSASSASSSSSTSASSGSAPGGGRYLGGKPKPSELIASSMRARERDQSRHALTGKSQHARYNVKGSGAKNRAPPAAQGGAGGGAPGAGAAAADVQELMGMGFAEAAVRAALQRAGGRKDRAVEILLGGS